jgi:putative glutamine amidotransferase
VAPRRSSFELDLVRLAARNRLPTLAICGGMQTMNVAFGGTLYQDIPAQVPDVLQHRQTAPAIHLSHSVSITPGTLLDRIVKRARMKVNSSHHQSVKGVGRTLIASASAPDGIVEAIEFPGHPFFLGLQWHPEFLFDRHPLHRQLFQAFLRAASRRPAPQPSPPQRGTNT